MQISAKKPGRPRQFDETRLIHDLMMIFWRHGFDGTTSALISSAAGLRPSSLYNTFGSKHGLFLVVLDHYLELLDDRLEPLTQGKEGLADIARFLRQLQQSKLASGAIPGCLMANTLGDGGESDPDISRRTKAYKTKIRNAFTRALMRSAELGEIRQGDVEASADVVSMALIGVLISSRGQLPGVEEAFVRSLMAVLEHMRIAN